MTAQPARRSRRKAGDDYTAATSRSSRASRPCAAGPACTSAGPTARAAPPRLRDRRQLASTRRWPASATAIDITIHADGSVDVVDNGRGIPVGQACDRRASRRSRRADACCTPAASSAAAATRSPAASTASACRVVNALSEVLRSRSPRDGSAVPAVRTSAARRRSATHREVARPTSRHRDGHRPPLHRPTRRSSRRSTTTSTRWPALPRDGLPDEGRSGSASWTSATTAQEKNFYFEGGIASFVRHLNRRPHPLHPEADLRRERRVDDDRSVEVALQYNDSYRRDGAHLRQQHQHDRRRHAHDRASASALTRALNDYARKHGSSSRTNDANLTRRRRARGPHGGDQREAARAAVRGPDQGQARQRRGRRAGRVGRDRRAVSTSKRTRGDGRRIIEKCDHARARARGRAQGARTGAAQGRAGRLDAAGQARRLPGARSRAEPNSTSSRGTRPAARRSRAATGASRRSCRCAARS